MAQNVQVCEIGDEIKNKLKKFRFRKEKTVAALILKVDPKAQTVIVEDEFDDVTVDDLKEELPEHQPRFLVLSYVCNHNDGRVSYPLCFIYICPPGGKLELNLMYAGTRNSLQNELGLTKVFELRNTEDFTQEWLDEKLAYFR